MLDVLEDWDKMVWVMIFFSIFIVVFLIMYMNGSFDKIFHAFGGFGRLF